ncbi:MAG TPA: class I SAM-dependent methyltransferase [Mycobacterium sp.]
MATGHPEVLVLQRDDHGGQTVVAFSLDDVAFLRSVAGAGALAEVANYRLTDATRIADVAAARAAFGDHAGVLVETVLLRRRAAAKFAEADRWLFTGEALQQATTAAVAAHRARRLEGRTVHDVTCSIGTELAALRLTAHVLGSDIDPVRLAMARHNVPDVPLVRADALRPVSRDAIVVADPARRGSGRRIGDPRAFKPPLDKLLDTYRSCDFVVKCSPGIAFDRLSFLGEVEVTSLCGEVREACLWSAGLAEPHVARRATMIRADESVEQVTDVEPGDCPVASAGRWIIDPDGAVVRAGLVRHYAARHGLWQLDPHIAYLSGEQLPPATRGFEVLEQIPFGERRLRRALAEMDCGAAEILVRGVDVDPVALRPRLRLRGTQQLSVVITRIGTGMRARSTAFICRPSR